MGDAEKAAGMQRGRPFKPGQSGNPAGKRKGTRNRSTIAAEALLDGEAEALTRKAIELALGGDTVAMRLCLERLLPPRKDRPITFALPTIATPDDAAGAIGAVLAAVAEGSITLGEAGTITALIQSIRQTILPAPPPSLPAISVAFVSADDPGRKIAGRE
jgi:hypothetical protein